MSKSRTHPWTRQEEISHAISATAGCLLCSTYFRRLLLNEGIKPEDFTPTAEEALLIELGHAIGNPQEPPKPDLMDRLKQHYNEPTLVNLVAYGGTMIPRLTPFTACSIGGGLKVRTEPSGRRSA